MKRWVVELFKERYPLPDYSERVIFQSKEEARNFAFKKSKKGFQTLILGEVFDEDEDRWINYFS